MLNARAGRSSVRVACARDAYGVARATLFKVDYPRTIDRSIDYFGSPRTERVADVRDTMLLPSLLDRAPA